jgi:hypothetical protein
MANKYTYTPFTYREFAESDETLAALKKKADAEKAVSNYGDFSWAQQGKYDNLIKEYENRPDFTYDFNADALYQQYKDKYIKQGKMAMADTIGQASAMTGGYGNSYAVTAGNQAYQAQLENLNDIIPELYAMAYDKHNQEGQELLNMIGLMGNERDFAYGQWGDKYNQLVADRGYYGDEYYNLYGRDYNKYVADRDLAQGEHTNTENMGYANYRDAIEDEQWQKTYDLSDRELKMAEEEWALKKKQYETPVFDDVVDYPKDNVDDNKNPQDPDPAPITPTKTKATTSFAASHPTQYEYLQRGGGRTLKQFQDYIRSEINKATNLSDAEVAYLVKHYGLA